MKKGLILEGGALRGMFSAGIMDVMMEHNVSFDGLIGVSAGAAFGCNYKSKQPGRVLRYNTRFANDWRYCSVRSLITTGDIFGGEFCYHEMPEKYDVFDTATFDANPMEYYVVCTDVETGEAVYSRQMQSGYDCYEWIRASASMPMVSRIVEINGQKLLDGGIADSIPLHFFESVGYDRNVVILTQPQGYMKEHNKRMPLLRFHLRKYPKMINALDWRHEMYKAQTRYVEEREKTGDVLVIRPDEPLHIGHVEHNPDRMRAVYNEGRKIGERRIGEILSFLKAI